MLPQKSLISHPYPKNCPNLLKIMIDIVLYSFHKTAFWVYVPNLSECYGTTFPCKALFSISYVCPCTCTSVEHVTH